MDKDRAIKHLDFIREQLTIMHTYLAANANAQGKGTAAFERGIKSVDALKESILLQNSRLRRR